MCLENLSPKEIGFGRSFYYYGYSSSDLTKLLMKSLKKVKKMNKLHLYNIFEQKKRASELWRIW